MPVKKKTVTFEQALSELETLVETLEKGELSLEDSLKSFARGVELTKTCQEALNLAEQKVQILSGTTEDAELKPFSSED